MGPFSNSSQQPSREDSLTSGSIGEMDGSMYDPIPVIISRQATNDSMSMDDLERDLGGLGISSTLSADHASAKQPGLSAGQPPHLEPHASAPAALETTEPAGPRKRPSNEEIQAKRRSLEKGRQESAAESGDDEDEELGLFKVRQRSPKRHVKRSSKLGTEMMRTNSQGSVISSDELVSPRMPSNTSAADTENVIIEESAREVEASGRLTPPEVFSRPGDHVEIIDMVPAPEDNEATPRPHHTADPDPDPTPRAASRQD